MRPVAEKVRVLEFCMMETCIWGGISVLCWMNSARDQFILCRATLWLGGVFSLVKSGH